MASPLVQVIDPPGLGKANPVYANVTSVAIGDSNYITIAGQVASTETGEIPGSMEEQVDLVLSKFERCLSSAGATVQDLVRFNYYVVDNQGDETLALLINKVGVFLKGHRPASTYCVLKQLSRPEFKVAFDGTAVTRTV